MPQIDDLITIAKNTQDLNSIEIEILDNGELKVSTGQFDGIQHTTAEMILKETASLLGSSAKQTAKKHRRHHSHTHIHQTVSTK